MSSYSGNSSFYNYQNLQGRSLSLTKRSSKHSNNEPVEKHDKRLFGNLSPRCKVMKMNLLNFDEGIPEEVEFRTCRKSKINFFTSPEEKSKVTDFYKKLKVTMKDKKKTEELLEATLKDQKTEELLEATLKDQLTENFLSP
jgi:hypothetical protein